MTPSIANAWRATDPQVLDALRDAEVIDLDLVYESSNYVFVAALRHPEYGDGYGVYKPMRGERPLQDFPRGLHRREVAAYELSRLLGWNIVPPTVERDGPEGAGSMQLFIKHDPREHYFVLREREPLHQQLVRLAAFDLVSNNADRKGGHVLRDDHDRLWAIDNGLCFNAYDKLRTVIWDFAGTELPRALLDDLERVRGCLEDGGADSEALRSLITAPERASLLRRCAAILETPVLPEMYPWRCTPWPLI